MIYIYLTNKMVLLRKQVMLLSNQNDELKNKLNRLILEQKLERQKKYSENNLIDENPEIRDLDKEL